MINFQISNLVVVLIKTVKDIHFPLQSFYLFLVVGPALSAGFNGQKIAHFLIESVSLLAATGEILVIENEKEMILQVQPLIPVCK
jgi:hypothetical protein